MNRSIVISDSVVRALGWALVHSLWQGAALALILLVLLPRLRTARQRYQVAYGALVAVFTVVTATFFWMFEPSAPVQIIANEAPPFGTFSSIVPELQTHGFAGALTDWLEDHHVLIILVWLLGFIFFLFRLGAGLWQVHKLQTQHVQPAEAVWQSRVDALGKRLGLHKAIGLFESALARSPMAIGWIKPVILFPVGLMNRLSPGEVEAILAHELAHIARRDWIFNLLQAFVEALFYYHPAVWWVSAVVRRERENCCDDAALAATGNPLIFAKALVQVQELATPAPRLALGIGGSSRRRPLLLERVRRILNQPQQKSQVMEKLTATAILLALLMIIGLRANTPPTVAAALSQITEWPGTLWNAENPDDQIATDSVPKSKRTQKITREDDNGKVEIELNNGEITRLNVDGKEIPPAEFNQYGKLAAELQRSASVAPAPPMPGFTPYPPMPGMPAIAPMPPMPPMPGMPAIAPMPPMPFSFHTAPMLSTETDKDGNVIIKLEKDGKPMEIKVKNGEVWMDGKKLEKGESIQLPGMGFNYNFPNDSQFNFEHLNNFEMPAIAFSFSDEDRARWEEDAARMREGAEEYREQYQALREQYGELSDEDKKTLEKELKELRENWPQYQEEWQKEMKDWQKDQGKWQLEQEKWAAEQEKWHAQQEAWSQHSSDFQRAIKDQLLRDKLVSDPKNYSFKLNSESLKIDGKKQSSEVHQQYLELYQSRSGNKMEKGDNYTIEEHK